MGRHRGRYVRGSLAIALVAALVIAPTGCWRESVPVPEDLVPVRLGVSEECMAALVFLAAETGTFAAHGLDVELSPMSSSALAAEALFAGEVDAATVADTPITIAAVGGQPFDLIATIGRSESDIQLIARSDHGIEAPGDLRGARIGTQEGTAAHYFLHSLLAAHGIDDADVEFVFAPFGDVSDMLLHGKVDAVSIREPFIGPLLGDLGEVAVPFSSPGLYVKTMNLLVSPQMDHSVRCKLVAALLDAEEYLVENGCEAYTPLLAEWIELPGEGLCGIICSDELVIRLEQGLILQLEDQARWVNSHRPEAEEPPSSDFLRVIDFGPLETIRPDRVRIIR